MALTRTTLSSAYVVGDNQIVVASATGFAADKVVRIDQEWFVVQKNYLTGTTIPVRGGQLGTKCAAHPATAGVVTGSVTDDFDPPGLGAKVNSAVAGRARYIESITTSPTTVTHTSAGSDHTIILNGTSVIALTIPIPTSDMDGDELTIISNGAAAHTLTFTGGLSGAGGNYDVITINATAPAAFNFVAANILWMVKCGPAMGGTVTNIIGSVA